ncbi:MAG: DegV family protein [Oscillospiraceae bacterium]|jgi:DegV family protein with EDD domain|nr:DegV family protein [Oscillospiraceae bacterium]
MQDYIIITDSTVDLPSDLTNELSIKTVALKFNIDGKERFDCLDTESMDIKEFYNNLRSGKLSSTSQINPNEFIEVFVKYLDEGKDILYISFSSALSGTFASAKIAADELKDKYPKRNIKVVDSLCASMGEGLLVYMAANMKKEGKTIFELESWINNNKLSVCHWFTVDDLNHLKRGGRVSSIGAFLGSMLNIKPILHVDNSGFLKFVTKVRGRQKSLEFLANQVGELGINTKDQIIFISHGDCLEDAEKLKDMIKRKFEVKEVKINTIGTVIGSHAGPGTVALFFVGKER